MRSAHRELGGNFPNPLVQWNQVFVRNGQVERRGKRAMVKIAHIGSSMPVIS
jgi:hypothetical protein